MKIGIILSFFALTTLLMFAFSAPTEERYTLTVTVAELRNTQGVVQFALYNEDGSIPDELYKKYYKLKKVNIAGTMAEVTFSDLPKGIYAVNILHDENKNGKIDKGFLLPKEGVGFSNFESINLANRPNFSKACFRLDAHKKIKVKVIYF